MVKSCIFLFSLFLSGFVFGQTSKTLNVSTAGNLSNLITATEASSITNLTISGNIDARDVAYMRDKITNLSVVDLSTASIKGYTGSDGTYSLATIAYPANEMPLCSFYNAVTISYKSTLTSVKLPSTLKSIGGSAFCYCYGLTGTFTIPASCTSIGSYALYGCSQLSAYVVETSNTRYSSNNGVLFNKKQDSLFVCPTAKTGSFTIPATVIYIGSSAFESCTGMTGNLTIPASVKTIDTYAFYYCSGFTGNLTLPTSLSYVGDYAFYGCNGLNGTVTIPKSLISIGSYVFLECNNLTSFQVDALNTKFTSNNDALYSKNQDTLHICPGAKSGNFTIPSTVRAIGSYAFYNCANLTGSLVIPKLTNIIGSYAFYGCNKLTAYETDPLNTKYYTSNGVLFNKAQDTLLVCPAGKTGSYSIPNTVKNIGTYSFYYCSGLSGSIDIPTSVKSIGDYAFYGCSQLSAFNVDAGNSVYSSIDGVLFNHNQDSLFICPLGKQGSYSIPNSVLAIDYSAFDGCTGLTAISIPNSVTSMGNYSFEYCTGLTEITLPKNITTIGTYAFYSCSNLLKISNAKAVPTTIDAYTFSLVDKTKCQLIVPTGSLAAYQTATNWKDFSSISEYNFDTAFQFISYNSPKIYGINNEIIVEGLKKGDFIEICNLQGKILFTSVSDGNNKRIDAKKNQYYLVNINQKATKIIL